MLENQFLGSLKWLVLCSLQCKFFTLLLEMDTATVLLGDYLKYANDLREAELEIVVCSDIFVGTVLVPTQLVRTAVPTNLSEQTIWCSSNRK